MRMKPILFLLVIFAFGMMGYTFSIGWSYHLHRAVQERENPAGKPKDMIPASGPTIGSHFIWGMMTGIAVSLTHTIVLTYFLGTGKAIKEQMELRQWDSKDYDDWKKLMAKAVIPASLGIVLIVIAAFSGGFTLIGKFPPSVHMVIAAVGIFGQVPIYLREFAVIRLNGELMDKIIEKLGGDDLKLTL